MGACLTPSASRCRHFLRPRCILPARRACAPSTRRSGRVFVRNWKEYPGRTRPSASEAEWLHPRHPWGCAQPRARLPGLSVEWFRRGWGGGRGRGAVGFVRCASRCCGGDSGVTQLPCRHGSQPCMHARMSGAYRLGSCEAVLRGHTWLPWSGICACIKPSLQDGSYASDALSMQSGVMYMRRMTQSRYADNLRSQKTLAR